MPFKKPVQKYSASINTVELGTGDKKIAIGGESVLPFYTFDGEIANAPKVGIEISDLGMAEELPGLRAYYDGAESVADIAKKAASMEGVDFVCLKFAGADPNGENKPVEDCVAVAKEVAEAIDLPLVIEGCKNAEKDAALFEKVADALQGKNVLFLSAKEENYKAVGAAVGLAYGQKVGGESSVDINLAKQLNVLVTQLGVSSQNIVMNLGTAAAGYGFEYVVSTMDRVKAAALAQNDAMLQMPIIAPIASDCWGVKEAVVSEEEVPEWGPVDERGICMEITTAVSCLASGANAVILKHPESVKTVSRLIKELI